MCATSSPIPESGLLSRASIRTIKEDRLSPCRSYSPSPNTSLKRLPFVFDAERPPTGPSGWSSIQIVCSSEQPMPTRHDAAYASSLLPRTEMFGIPIHKLIIHFPVALTMMALVYDAWAIYGKKPELHRTGYGLT